MVCVEMVMKIKVTLPHDPLWYALEWAVKNCPSYINEDHEIIIDHLGLEVITSVNYYFNDERDALVFKLRWA
jgi:hypothetical protein